MKLRRTWLWLLLLVPSLGVGGTILHDFSPDPTPVPEQATSVFADAGYLTLRLTSGHHAPGSLYSVEEGSDGFVVLHPTCNVDPDELEEVTQVQRTADVSMAIAQKLAAGSAIEPGKWSVLEFDVDVANTKEIRSVFSNSTIELVNTETILRLRDSYLQRDDCFAAVKTKLAHGYEVCQTEAVIVSDLVYRVKKGASGGLGLKGLIDAVAKFATTGKFEWTIETKVEGGKMYHAVRLHRPKRGKSCILLNTAAVAADDNQGR